MNVIIPLLACLVLCGCQSEEVEPPQPAAEQNSLPPSQVNRGLKQLSSDRPQEQMRGIVFLEKFPELKQSYRHLLVKLTEEGNDPRVREMASKALE